MDEKKRRRPRRPRGGDHREPRDDAAKERAEREFRRELETRFNFFLDSDEDELELEPMNSFRRRIAHTVAKEFNFDTESRGEEPNRYVALIKTEDSAAPEGGITPEPEDDEPAEEQPREAREERRPARSDRPAARSERPAARGERPARKWDYGNQTFPIEPGDKGLRLALKIDGSLEVWRESEEDYIIFDRMVTAREVRVRDGKIVQPGEPGW